MRTETVPTPSNPERPPLAPYDPPEPAPQAKAWHRALKVIACVPPPPRGQISLRNARRVKWW